MTILPARTSQAQQISILYLAEWNSSIELQLYWPEVSWGLLLTHQNISICIYKNTRLCGECKGEGKVGRWMRSRLIWLSVESYVATVAIIATHQCQHFTLLYTIIVITVPCLKIEFCDSFRLNLLKTQYSILKTWPILFFEMVDISPDLQRKEKKRQSPAMVWLASVNTFYFTLL